MVAETNAKSQLIGRDLRLSINEYADMSYNEFISLKGGLVKDQFILKESIPTSADISTDVTAVDWTKKDNIVNPVKNQGGCGSCWAFSTIATLESRWAINSGKILSLSEQQLIDCDKKEDQGCNGGLMDNAFTYLTTHGIETEAD